MELFFINNFLVKQHEIFNNVFYKDSVTEITLIYNLYI